MMSLVRLLVRPRFVLGIVVVAFAFVSAGFGCSPRGSSPSPMEEGQGGEGGCPVRPPQPQFVLQISAEDGPLPLDTRVVVEWSAADEPPFVLADPATWKTLDDGVNLFCRVDRNQPPPPDLSVLVCELWTAGAVNVLVEAPGYTPHTETLKPVMSEMCDEPMPTEVAILLSRAMMDAGPMP